MVRLLSLLAVPVVLVACSGEQTSTSTPVEAPKAASGALVIKGSDSEVNVVQRLAEEFMKSHPDVSLSVTGGGSGTGIASLIEGTCDLANSSRELKGAEKVQASRAGVTPTATVFATDGLSIIVNTANPIEELSLDQAGAIFRGEVTTWESLGHTGAITPYGRQSNSGTYSFFKDAVVKGDFAPTVREMNGNAQIVEGVRSDVGAVGYVAVGYLKEAGEGLKVLRISGAEGQPATSPLDQAAVLSGAYPIARPLYQYTNGVPTGALLDFLKYEQSPEGQAIITSMGFYPVAEAYQAANAHLQ